MKISGAGVYCGGWVETAQGSAEKRERGVENLRRYLTGKKNAAMIVPRLVVTFVFEDPYFKVTMQSEKPDGIVKFRDVQVTYTENIPRKR